jgi:hypothetical protein
MHRCQRLVQPFRTVLELVLWNGLKSYRRITPAVINVIKMPSFQYFLYHREQQKFTGGTYTNISLISLPLLPSLTRNLMFVHCFNSSSDILATAHQNSDNNRRHSERDCHRSTTTQLWNADMPSSSNHTEGFVHCCHGKYTVASSRTLLSDLVGRVETGILRRTWERWCHFIMKLVIQRCCMAANAGLLIKRSNDVRR